MQSSCEISAVRCY